MSEEQERQEVPEPMPLSEEVQAQLDQMQEKVSAAYAEGYQKGREAQLLEDGYYVRRVAELARLLGQAEQEIQRLREVKEALQNIVTHGEQLDLPH